MQKKNVLNICAVTIWYNPDEECVKNVGLYNKCVGKVYIVDNSSVSNIEKTTQYPNVVYIANCDNLGIAKALNQGCQKALEDGFEFCMTMDQDSQWEENQLVNYFDQIQKNITDKNVSFAPSCVSSIKRTSVLGDLKRILSKKNKQNEMPQILFDNLSIATSGNVINLKIWNTVGKFYEPLFIDMVDYDFNCRLLENGFSILQFSKVKFVHSVGNNHRSFLPCESHSPVRVYYMARNTKYFVQMHENFLKNKNCTINSSGILRNILINFHIKKLIYYIRGIKDFKRNVTGELLHDR